jgi:hypothetical protein
MHLIMLSTLCLLSEIEVMFYPEHPHATIIPQSPSSHTPSILLNSLYPTHDPLFLPISLPHRLVALRQRFNHLWIELICLRLMQVRTSHLLTDTEQLFMGSGPCKMA